MGFNLTTARCSSCGEDKAVEDFHRHSKRGVQSSCKPCQREKTYAWRRDNPRAWRAHILKSKGYGLSIDAYEAMLEAQGYCCALCGRTAEESTSGHLWLAVDHDHETGRVRELLCIQCNGMLGMARDNAALLRLAADYIERHAA